MVDVTHLCKKYKIAKRKPGVFGAVKGLFHKDYEIKSAVSDVNFHIDKGEMVGYIGANGAGKSTTIKMLSGILVPSSGEVRVNGIIPYQERVRNAKNIGAVFGQRTQLFWDIPVRESYSLLRHIYQVPEEEFRVTMNLFHEVLDLEPLLGIPVRQLSLGQKMRCELGAAFLHNPRIVYLDEPTIGLDVHVKAKIRKFIKEMNRVNGTTIILTTHDMQDIEEICNRVIIIDAGSILYDGGLKSIKETFGDRRTVHFDLENSNQFILPNVLCDKVTQLAPSGENPQEVSLSFNASDLSAADVISAVMQTCALRDVRISDTSIESIVKQIYERKEM